MSQGLDGCSIGPMIARITTMSRNSAPPAAALFRRNRLKASFTSMPLTFNAWINDHIDDIDQDVGHQNHQRTDEQNPQQDVEVALKH